MIATDQELHTMLERIRHFQEQVAHRLSVSGFLAEIDRMQLEVREYLSLHPADVTR